MFITLILRLLVLYTIGICHVTGHSHNHESGVIECNGEIKMGKIHITENMQDYADGQKRTDITKIPDDCATLEIKTETGSEINFEKIEGVPSLPKLKNLNLLLTLDNFIGREFEFRKLSLIDPKEVIGLGIDSFVFMNENEVLNLDGEEKYLYINKINPIPILNSFAKNGVPLKSIHISDTEVKDGTHFMVPDEVTIVALDNVKILPNFFQKFTTMEDLHLIQNFETVDVAEILKSKTLVNLFITNATLTSKDTAVKSETLKTLTLTNCVPDKSFKENAPKMMPNLTSLEYTRMPGMLDFIELLNYKQLKHISLEYASLSFTRAPNKYQTLEGVHLTNCEFDMTMFTEFAANTFPNLKYLGVDASGGGTRPTQDFLNNILAKFPDIEQVAFHPFELAPKDLGRNGMFEIVYNRDSHSAE